MCDKVGAIAGSVIKVNNKSSLHHEVISTSVVSDHNWTFNQCHIVELHCDILPFMN